MELIDTIASLITSLGGAVGGIRLSGPRSLEVSQQLFSPLSKDKNWQPRYAYFGKFKDEGKLLDEGLAIYFKAPYSYTGEDVVELFFHGSQFIGQRILQAILKKGIRLAKRGEFTRRAFYNGKMDLVQAESVSYLYQVRNEKALDMVLRNLTGQFSNILSQIKEKIVSLLSSIEAYLDFPELEFEVEPEKVLGNLREIQDLIYKVLSNYQKSQTVYQGYKISLLGIVNSGKSSLLNRLLEEDKAITAPIPGTTRDIVEGEIYLNGLHYKFYDLAGLRPTEDKIERVGIRKALQKARESDLVLVVMDITQKDVFLNQKILQKVKKYNYLIAYNKIDLLDKRPQNDISSLREVFISAKMEWGMDELKKKILALTSNETNLGEQLVLTSERHKNGLEQALQALYRCRESLELGYTYDCLTVDLQEALYHLQELIGEVTTEDILDNLFANFCIGK
jgi:tRNA modification GTPase